MVWFLYAASRLATGERKGSVIDLPNPLIKTID
jgi:hypothetical protein